MRTVPGHRLPCRCDLSLALVWRDFLTDYRPDGHVNQPDLTSRPNAALEGRYMSRCPHTYDRISIRLP